jgi:L-iditol 2-dehydrogenase
MEPMSVAIHARNRASLAANSTVLVFGAGAVGLLTAAVVKASKAKHIIICDIQKDRVDFAVANGFADASFVVPMVRPETLEAKLKFAQEVASMAKDLVVDGKAVGEVDVCFECTGVESCVQSAIYVSSSYHRLGIITSDKIYSPQNLPAKSCSWAWATPF